MEGTVMMDEGVEETMIIKMVRIMKIGKKTLLHLKEEETEEEEVLIETKEVVMVTFLTFSVLIAKKYGHFQVDCWALKHGDGNNNSTMMYKEEKNDKDALFLACSVQEDVVEPTWYLDSNCSNYKTEDRIVFVTLD